MKAYKIVNEAIRKLEERIKQSEDSPVRNDDYIQGLEHAVRFIKIELHDALQKDGE